MWGIGVDGDQSFLGPHVLTSALKGVDSAVFLTIKALQDGTFKGGKNVVFGIDQDGVGLGTLSPKANKQDVAAIEKVERKLADGEITGHPDDRQLNRQRAAARSEQVATCNLLALARDGCQAVRTE